MARIAVGHFLGDTGIVYLPIGFVPDYFRMADIDSGTSNAAVCLFEWFERLEDDEASQSQEGWALGFSTAGYTTLLADDAGITAYDTAAGLPFIGVWRASDTSVLDKAGGNATSLVARTATVHGTYIIGTTSGTDSTGQTVDRDAIFECITAGTTGSSEPTWPVEIGEQVTDNSCAWERVNVPLGRIGYQGVCIQDNIQSNTHEYYYLAIDADASVDHGDVDGWAGGVKGA